MSEKYHIERNSVQETLVIPLYGRARCGDLYPEIFSDPDAGRIMEQLDYDFSALNGKENVMLRFGYLECACRQYDLAWEVKDYLKNHPNAAVVNLGCGLDAAFRHADNGTCRGYNLDFSDVIELRNKVLPAGERERNISCDLNDPAWFDSIDFREEDGAVFFAAGVFYYFQKAQVRALLTAMASRFPGAVVVFDAANKAAVKMMLKTWIKKADIQDVGAYFSVSDAAGELSGWSGDFRKVSSRGYMQGYVTLGRKYSPFFRLLARMGDSMMKMQIVRVEFKKDITA